MSYANGTTHFNLPITTGSDKRDWFDTNQAFQDIDAAIYQAGEDASTAGSGVTTLDTQINGVGGIDSRLTTAESDIDNVEDAVSTLQGTVSGHTTAIADVRRDLQDNIEAFNEPTATSTHAYAIGDYFYYNDILYKATAAIAIGDTIVPNTNCTATDVMSEVASNSSAGNISLSPITGMTADDVQEGIEELKSDLPQLFATISCANSETLSTAFAKVTDAIKGLDELTAMRLKIYTVHSGGIYSIERFSSSTIRYALTENVGSAIRMSFADSILPSGTTTCRRITISDNGTVTSEDVGSADISNDTIKIYIS